jgi:hypothetical protein
MRTRAAQTLLGRLAWFVGLWLAGVGTVGIVSLAIKAWLR